MFPVLCEVPGLCFLGSVSHYIIVHSRRRIMKDLFQKGAFYSKTAVLDPFYLAVSLFSLALFLFWKKKVLSKNLVYSRFKVPSEYCSRRFLFVPLMWIILHAIEDLVKCQVHLPQGVHMLRLWSMRGKILCTLSFTLTLDYVKCFCTWNPLNLTSIMWTSIVPVFFSLIWPFISWGSLGYAFKLIRFNSMAYLSNGTYYAPQRVLTFAILCQSRQFLGRLEINSWFFWNFLFLSWSLTSNLVNL